MSIIHWIGIDDHADKWTIAHIEGSAERPSKEFELVPDASGHRKLIGFLKSLNGEARVAYEAGPCGYDLYRRLKKAGIWCEVAAPSLTPIKPGNRVKTNRRDALKIARALRSGDLTFIAVPDATRESLRDLTRARENAKVDLGRARHHITKLLLRYGHRYREGKAWTQGFWRWLGTIRLKGENSQFVLEQMIDTLRRRIDLLARFDAAIEEQAQKPEYVPYLNALRVLRGIGTLSAMVVLAELGDLRRFSTAPQLMAAIGVVPSESSTGDKVVRFAITKTGNAHVRHILVEAAWQYQRRITTGPTMRKRRKDQPKAIVEIAEKCDHRLHRKYTRMTSRGKLSTVAAVAVARELAGFIWAVGQQAHP